MCNEATSLEPLASLSNMRQLILAGCTSLTSLEPLGSLPRLLDLNLSSCYSLPAAALSPLARCTALKVLDLQGCLASTDLSPLASCHDLRRLYVGYWPDITHQGLKFKANLKRLRGLMPRLVVKQGDRTKYVDAKSL
jgi:hypothetical protein